MTKGMTKGDLTYSFWQKGTMLGSGVVCVASAMQSINRLTQRDVPLEFVALGPAAGVTLLGTRPNSEEKTGAAISSDVAWLQRLQNSFDSFSGPWHKPRSLWQTRRRYVATTLAELEQRLQVLEEEVASLREFVKGSSPTETPGGHEARRPREAEARPTDGEVTTAAVHQRTGISGEAPGLEQLRALLAAHGVHPGDEVVRQEIAAMREQAEEEEAREKGEFLHFLMVL
jgi:hypothetical protein